jgi:acetyltransferase-like isoleucine patch superfamily enzyme
MRWAALFMLKTCVNFVAALIVLPAWLAYRLGSIFIGAERAFPGWSQAFSLLPGLTGVYLRRAFYRMVLPECAASCCISFGTVFSHPAARVGRNVYIGLYCTIGEVTIEDDVLIASNVSIMNGGRQHSIDRLDVPIREQMGEYPRVTIGTDSWIGERSLVMANVGRHAVVAGGAVVTKPVADYAVVGGVPARVLRWRDSREDRAEAVKAAIPAEILTV